MTIGRLARRLAAAVCALGVVAGAAYAQSPESLAWLRKIQDATRNLSYTGTFVYQQGNRNETSRITRYVDATGHARNEGDVQVPVRGVYVLAPGAIDAAIGPDKHARCAAR